MNTIQVHNSTITQGKILESFGTAHYLGGYNFRVYFPISEINKIIQSDRELKEVSTGEFRFFEPKNKESNQPNYVIDHLWLNCYGDYIFAVVTDSSHQALYVLSRYKHPSLIAYNQVMEYVVANFDRDRLVQTPHFD